MAANDEEIKLILKLQGQAEAEQLRAKMAALREQIVAAGAASGTTSPQVLKLAEDFRAAEAKVEALDKAFGRAKSGMAGYGQSALQAGRITQDFVQGGIGGILNNIEGLAQALGGGAGLAGLLTIVGTAAFIAKPYLMKLFEGGGKTVDPLLSDIDRVKARIKELSDKPIKLAVERAEIQALEADLKKMTVAQEAYNEAKGLKGKHETQSEAAVKELIAETNANARATGGSTVEEALKTKATAEVFATDDGLKALEKQAKEARRDRNVEAQAPSEFGHAEILGTLDDKLKAANDAVEAKKRELTGENGEVERKVGAILKLPADQIAKALDDAISGDEFNNTGLAGVGDRLREVTPSALKHNE